jgi:hypothetical protein
MTSLMTSLIASLIISQDTGRPESFSLMTSGRISQSRRTRVDRRASRGPARARRSRSMPSVPAKGLRSTPEASGSWARMFS